MKVLKFRNSKWEEMKLRRWLCGFNACFERMRTGVWIPVPHVEGYSCICLQPQFREQRQKEPQGSLAASLTELVSSMFSERPVSNVS